MQNKIISPDYSEISERAFYERADTLMEMLPIEYKEYVYSKMQKDNFQWGFAEGIKVERDYCNKILKKYCQISYNDGFFIGCVFSSVSYLVGIFVYWLIWG